MQVEGERDKRALFNVRSISACMVLASRALEAGVADVEVAAYLPLAEGIRFPFSFGLSAARETGIGRFAAVL